MIVLCAYYAGNVKPENQPSFDRYVKDVHLASVATWPGLSKLRLLKNDGKPYLEEVPKYYHCFELTFENMEAYEGALRSRQREETGSLSRADRAQFRDLFEGEVRHALYDIKDFTPPLETGKSPALLRCAYYWGTVDPADRKIFDTYIDDVHLPDVANWPHLRHLRWAKNNDRKFQDGKPQYYQAFELAFDCQADMDACMASKERAECRRISAQDHHKFKDLFKGQVHHVNYTCFDIAVDAA